ncbi:MAG: PsbP-related protein [Candidatus Methanospirareceae archaeon]
MAKEKFNIWTLIIVISFVVATLSAGYIGYWFGSSKYQPLSTLANSTWNKYIDQNLNFSFLYPANWSGEIAKEGYLLLKGPADERGHIPNIIVQAMLPAGKGGNYTSYEDAASDMLAKLNTYDNYSLISYTQTTVSNESAREIVCSYSYGGVALKQSQVFFQDPTTGYIYMICYTATEERYPEYIGVFEKARETFKLPGGNQI